MKLKITIPLFVTAFLSAFALVVMAQTSFDTARVHQHVVSATYEGVWVKRMLVPAQNPISYPLGNQLAVRGATNELWFYYGFEPIRDGPLISTAEGTPSGRKVRVTYDPVCFYITKIEDLGAVAPSPSPSPTPTPTPQPTPSPSPTPLTADFPWPSTLAAQRTLREQSAQNGWRCSMPPYNGRLWCERP